MGNVLLVAELGIFLENEFHFHQPFSEKDTLGNLRDHAQMRSLPGLLRAFQLVLTIENLLLELPNALGRWQSAERCIDRYTADTARIGSLKPTREDDGQTQSITDFSLR